MTKDFVSGEDCLGEKLIKKFVNEVPHEKLVKRKYSGVTLEFAIWKDDDDKPHIWITNSEAYLCR
jgi:hypothetical protein